MRKLDSFKLLLSFCALAISLSIGYYFLFYLPTLRNVDIAKEKAQELYQRKETCSKQAENYHENLKRDVAEKGTVLNPSYHYNSSLEKCFYSGGTLQGNMINKFVLDIGENKDVAMYLSEVNGKALIGSSCDACVDLEDFDAKKKELFEE